MPPSYGYTSHRSTKHGRATRRALSERLADPYLSDDDRWVLRQFERFLGGHASEPDPRGRPVRIERLLPGRS